MKLNLSYHMKTFIFEKIFYIDFHNI